MKKLLKTRVFLCSPTDKTTAPMQIHYDDSDDAVYPVKINLTYNNTQYSGDGTDHLWTDAFADLQRKLPDDIKIACCMTCRYGNMCTFGNEKNQLFCTKDTVINSKDDMIKFFIETNPFAERAVSSTNYCNDFVYQSDDFYTYNDFLYYLRKNNKL